MARNMRIQTKPERVGFSRARKALLYLVCLVVAWMALLFVANFFGDVPQTVLAPALLFEDATVRRANETNDKLPFYPPPGD